MDVASYQYFSNLFAPLNDDLPVWKRDALLKGCISCAGVGAEGLLRASRIALLREIIANEAETQPLLELIAFLLYTLPSILPSDIVFK
jgi:hypothetical protein